MIAAFKSEIRNILTVRSTYGVLIATVVLLGFFAFFAQGIKATPELLADKYAIANTFYEAIRVLSVVGALVGVMLVTHEYRYNTIVYTLTASRSRVKVLAAKVLAVSVFAILFTLLVCVICPLFMLAGLAINGGHLVPQTIPFADILWRVFFVGWGYSMLTSIIALLVRGQVIAIIAVFMFPITVEPILGIVLKQNTKYLPFSALSSVGANGGTLSPTRAAIVVMTYLLAGWIISAMLFRKRDAN